MSAQYLEPLARSSGKFIAFDGKTYTSLVSPVCISDVVAETRDAPSFSRRSFRLNENSSFLNNELRETSIRAKNEPY